MYTVVGLVRSLQAGWSGFDSWQGRDFFHSYDSPDGLQGPSSLLFSGFRGHSMGARQFGPEANY